MEKILDFSIERIKLGKRELGLKIARFLGQNNISSLFLVRQLIATWPLIQKGLWIFLKRAKVRLRQNFRGSSKDPLLYLRLFLIFFLVILIFSFNFSFSENLFPMKIFSENENGKENLFLGQKGNQPQNLSYFKFSQGNSLFGFSVPPFPQPKVLGVLSGKDNLLKENKEVIEYLVEPGDTLSSLSEKFGISLETIIWTNNLQKNSKLKVGQKILILPVSGLLHYVKKGESLSQIAKTYQADLNEIITFNELTDQEIFAGDILIIPDGKMPQPKKSPTQNFVPPPSIPLASSYFIFPTQGKISQGLHWYNAIDIAASCGTPIYAAAQGQVLKTKFSNSGLGNYIAISHPNGTTTYYGHLQTILVSPGQEVSQGQIIGYIGRTGRTTGCHVHFEVRGARNPFAG